jgi:hypothetical protein
MILNFDRFRKRYPEWADEEDHDIAREFARDMKINLEPGVAGWRGFDPTFYVRSERGNIKDFRPYAAVELLEGRWLVPPWRPSEGWGPQSFPERMWDEFATVAEELEAILELDEPERAAQAKQAIKTLKQDRNDAYTIWGKGILDERNVLFQYLGQLGILRRLEQAAYRRSVAA